MHGPKERLRNIIFQILAVMAMAVALSIGMDQHGVTIRRSSFVLLVAVSLAVLAIVTLIKDKREGRNALAGCAIIWTIAGGILVRIGYILYTETWLRQHDVIAFGATEGHAAYIEYILANWSLPECDPRSIWGFFQPPLHHTISAVWMWLIERLGKSEIQAQESIQVLTLCYMCILTLTVYNICRELNVSDKGSLIAMLIVSFHPIYFLLSGSINNDALSLCLSAAAVYFAIIWYKEPGLGKLMLVALTVGLAMMAKLSAGLIAPGIGALMIYKLILTIRGSRNAADTENAADAGNSESAVRAKNATPVIRLLLQYICFGIVVVPIGLWWPVRNMVKWDMPFNYIPPVGEQLTKTGFVSRVLDIRTKSVYPSLIGLGDEYDEYNVILAMIKTSLFGEYNYGQYSNRITLFAVIMFVAAVALIIMGLYATAKMIFSKKSSLAFEWKLVLGGVYITTVIGYLSFALGYSNFSAMDFRYAALAIAVEALFIGMYADGSYADPAADKVNTGEDESFVLTHGTAFGRAALAVSVIFAGSSAAVYLLLGMYQVV